MKTLSLNAVLKKYFLNQLKKATRYFTILILFRNTGMR